MQAAQGVNRTSGHAVVNERVVWTIGHSTRSVQSLFSLLRTHDIELLFDVRRFPASRRHPQFNCDALSAEAAAHGVAYEWMKELGGRRSPLKDSHNTAWRNAGFRGYADYMETEPFARAIAALRERALGRRVVIMCAERAWQQCHRGLIADYLKANGDEVWHIVAEDRVERHPYTAAARIIGGVLSYREHADDMQSGFEF
jgi:uncharacterized protein (DUF488 family)